MKFILYIFCTLMILYGIYFVITCISAFKRKKKIINRYESKHKLAVVIAARNEEKVIGDLIKSLSKSDYPKNLYEVYVVPNNCSDNTKEVALTSGAKIIESKKEIKDKSGALNVAFSKLLRDKTIDAFIIFDADNVVDSKFLSRMNDTLCEGYLVAQGFRDSKNPKDNWISGCGSLYYYIMNFFYNKSRMEKANTSVINGTGFMVSRSILEKYGFNTVTLTEDIEFATQCRLNDLDIAYVDDAITYDEQATEFVTSWKQRKRWAKGFYQVLSVYHKDIIKKIFKSKDLKTFDMLMLLIGPLTQVVSFIVSFLLTILWILQLNSIVIPLIVLAIMFVIFYIVIAVLCAITVKKNNQKCSEVLWGILTFPIFLVTWIPIMFLSLFKKNIKWEHIEHKRKVSIEDLKK